MNSGLIVSCQALQDEPLHSSLCMSRMALAAKQGGASGIRANSVEDIEAIKNAVDLPIIGIIKKVYPDMIPYITPTIQEVNTLYQLNIDTIAIDATTDQDIEFLKYCLKNFSNQKFMADISTMEEAYRASSLGFDYIGTTLVGYTAQSKDIHRLQLLKEMIKELDTKIIAEGGFNTPLLVKEAIDAGAYAVVVGSAITRPQWITQQFVNAIT